MNFYFNTGRASRASQNNQDTAFFQAGEASKTSIFDNQQPSQTQYAYELFNQESKEPNNKQKSIISKLDQFNRETDFEELPNIVQQNQNQSSDQNESRMTFGMKMSNKLYESNVGQSKPKTFKSLLEKQPSGMKNEQVNNIVKINKDYSSNFSLKIDSFEKTPVQIQSVPLEIKGTRNKPLQTSQSLSSSSFDLQEYKSRKLLKKDKGIDVQLQQNSNIDSEAKILAEPNNRQSLKIQKKIFPSLNSNTLSTEKRQVFNLRKSKVEQNSKEKPLKYCFNKDSNFSSTSNRPQNPPITTPQKVIEPQKQKPQESKVEPKKSFLEIQKQNLRKSGVKQPSSKFNLSNFKIKQSNSEILKLPNQNSQKELIQSPPNNKHTQMQKITLIEDKRQILKSQIIEKQKKQALGLKQQLKKLGSRPTEKIQLKSIAYNPTFKFKNKLQIKQTQPQIKPQAIKQPSQYSNNRQAQRIVQDLPKSNKFISTFRDDKTQSQPHSKSHRSSQFSRAMLALMQVQQQSQIVRQKVVHSRNTYRQLAIMNDDISKRIDQVLRRATKK